MDSVAQILFDYLYDILYNPAEASLDMELLPEGFRELGEGMECLLRFVTETRTFAGALAKGDFNAPFPSRDNEFAAPVKALHATLKHLTWQTQQVAQGDYHQRVDYLGDFAEAFNTMTRQLEQRYLDLTQEIERSRLKTLALEQANDLFETITRENAQWICVFDRLSGEWLFQNHPFGAFFRDEALFPQLQGWLRARTAETGEHAPPYSSSLELSIDGRAQFFSVMLRPVMWRDRAAVVFVLTDISAEREHLRELEDSAYYDTLTHQYNRHYGMRQLERWVEEKRRFALCFLDIDNLKYVNDKYGHQEGDRYILSVVAVLNGFAADATVCRLGGDEFMLLAENWEQDTAQTKLEALRSRLIEKSNAPDAPYYHSVSYGVVSVGEENKLTPSELLAAADSRMYDYKRAHKRGR